MANDFIDVEINVSVGVTFVNKERGRNFFSRAFGNWLPGDPGSLVIKKIELSKDGKTIDIKDFLPQSELDYIDLQVEKYLE